MAAETESKVADHVVIVGGGFSGFFAARLLLRTLGAAQVRVTIVTDSDGLLYQPLLPEVAVGTLDPRTIVVPLSTTLRSAHLVRGRATGIDWNAQRVAVDGRTGTSREVPYDRLLISAGSVSRMVDVPGLAEHGVGFKSIGQALYLRDLVLTRLEAANDEGDQDVRRRLLTFVVVGAGYAGTELAAQMSRLTSRLVTRFPGVQQGDIRWMLVDMAATVMPELGGNLGHRALQLLQRRGVEVRLNISVKAITQDGAVLTDGTVIPGAVVVWCAGVEPSPIVAAIGLPTTNGRIVVGSDLGVPGYDNVYAAGDAAAVPDLTRTRDARGTWPLCPPTAQHAMRQGRAVARNIIADVRRQPRRPYRHHGLGLVVDLGGSAAVANPLGVHLSGRTAKLITRSYHVAALPTVRRRLRAAAGWALAGREPDDVAFGLPMAASVLAQAEHSVDSEASER